MSNYNVLKQRLDAIFESTRDEILQAYKEELAHISDDAIGVLANKLSKFSSEPLPLLTNEPDDALGVPVLQDLLARIVTFYAEAHPESERGIWMVVNAIWHCATNR